ncbi:MarR family winged helix-turn-helix transcriptional regulator [Gallaecimonas mangrovi]|uniref:MarR family winged helix-turn-helix transcriptional regulator n=1 Tax=Gallaecimonas mangrovi TaxID=2291597 RepID=UPI000E1FF4D6|nr:MarR family transcriptional regulator [Gallaecimonas mangrovi]
MNIDTEISQAAAELRAALSLIKRRLRERGRVDLTPSQTDVLRHLDRLGCTTVSKLAREMGMRSQSLGAIVSTLIKGGYISSQPDPSDGRQTLLALTDDFKNKLEKGRAAHADWLASKMALLPADDRATLVAATAILRRIGED